MKLRSTLVLAAVTIGFAAFASSKTDAGHETIAKDKAADAGHLSGAPKADAGETLAKDKAPDAGVSPIAKDKDSHADGGHAMTAAR